ncbi:transglutaminase domain-containing protein [Microbacteriaceae bacterium VKM Ac-2854]|nr:transglutaminase domain-containing protein [Microbacteriaceae bacterium VKM Ac-2854]
MSARRAPAAGAVDVLALILLLGVGVVGFGRVFEGVDHLIAGGLGILTGAVVAVVGARFRLGLLSVAGLTVAGYLLVGSAAAFRPTAIAGVLPTLDTLLGLLVGSVTAWKSLLTVAPPANGFAELLIVPFLSALVCAVVAVSVALRASRPGWALLPAGLLLVVSILFGTPEAVAPLAQALAFGVVGLAWFAWRSRPTGETGTADSAAARQLRLRRGGSAAAILAIAAAVAFGTAGAVAPTAHRSVLREEIVPPFDLHDYPTPLASYRKIVRDQKEATLFTVTGLPEGARVRLATMDAFDGTVFNVAGGGGNSGSFARVGSTIADEHTGAAATIRFETGELTGVWLPDVGYPSSVTFTGERAETLSDSLHYNAETGVAVVTSRLAAGDAYTVTTTIPPVPSDEELAGDVGVAASGPAPMDVPEAVATETSAAIGEASDPVEQVRAIAATLSTQGFFSHGLEGETDSRPGHGAERLQALLAPANDQMIGDDEQYATAMALMVDQLGLPARVVMGFYPPAGTDLSAPIAVTGADLHAWVEVAFAGAGWVAFDPTPPEDQVPQDQTPLTKTQPNAQVLQPPPPPQEPAVVPPDVIQEDDTDDDEKPDLGWIGVLLAIAGGVLGLLVLLFGPALVIGGMKRRKRTARQTAQRPADRISGGWDEVVDRVADLGTVLPEGSTRREHAERLSESYPSVGVTTLARQADATVFGPADPSEAEVAAFWNEADALVAQLHGSVSPLARLRARLSLRSLRPAWLARASAAARDGIRTNTARSVATTKTRPVAGNEDTDD